MQKKTIAILLCVALALLVFATYAGAISGNYRDSLNLSTGVPTGAGLGINNTVHDLRRHNTFLGIYTSQNTADPLDRLCIFCHAPHHTYRLTTAGATGTGPLATADATYLPLWNHTITQTVFQPYLNGPGAPQSGPKHAQSTDNINGGSQGTFDRIGAASLLCLSCHDGSIAVNEYGHLPQSTISQSSGGNSIAAEYNIGKSGYLANHHPIGFDYQTVAGLDPEIFDANVAVFDQTYDGGSNQIPVANLLWGGKMECSTCHAVHNTGNTGEKLLYVSDKNSNLCFSCHNKGQKTANIVLP